MYRVEVASSARKDLRVIDSRYTKRLLATTRSLGEDPFSGKKLGDGHRSRYSKRVGPYRILYHIDKSKRIITVVRIGHRQYVYQ